MKKKAKLVTKIVSCSVMFIVFVALVVGTAIAFSFRDVVTSYLVGLGSDFSEATTELKNGDELCVQIAEESITLLRNEKVSDGKPALPLRSNVTEVSVFGYGGTDKGFLAKGVGSGSSTIEPEKYITLLQGITGHVRDFDIDDSEYVVDGTPDEAKLEAAKQEFAKTLTKYDVNAKIQKIYEDFAKGKNNARDTQDVLIINDDYTKKNVFKLDEPSIDEFTDGIMRNAATSSNGVALFVISRDGGENLGEMPTRQTVGGKTDSTRTYLDLSSQEEDMLKWIKKYYDTTIVILNTTNTMHMGFLENEDLGIDACLYVGLLGQSGTRALPEILSGKINPSGKYTDIVTRNSSLAAKFDPTYSNFTQSGGIRYVEDIYYGYKWYETAAVDNFIKKDNTAFVYDDVVVYPFGHGLSYTTFKKELESVYYYNGDTKVELTGSLDGVPSVSTTIYADVKVTNTGNAGGKEVVELYYTPEYKKGGIEKAAINLLAFEKTKLLESGEDTTVTLSFTLFDMASYDEYDKNSNNFWGYELEAGTYDIKLNENSHDEIAKVTLSLSAANAMQIDKDPVTQNPIVNRFTGKREDWADSYDGTAYAGCGSDGYEAGVAEDWLSRSDFAETFPEGRAAMHTDKAVLDAAAQFTNTAPYENIDLTFKTETAIAGQELYLWKKADGSKATLTDLNGKGEEIVPNYELFARLADYGDETLWNQLLDQMSLIEIKHLVEWGGFKRIATESVGLRRLYDNDGPAGFNGESLGDHTGKWTAYASESLMGCSWNINLMFLLGRAMGAEANATSINGWYAPGVNLHRSSYNARNFEYYSEDGVLSGQLAVQVIAGAKTNGLNCYLKHFACSELGNNPVDVTTWITEQNLRENYLKPFEIAAKGIDIDLTPVDEEGNELADKTETIHVGANSLMTAFNRVGASWAGANYAMNVQVLREEWGFNGTLITDWTSINWGNAHENKGSMRVEQGIRAGNDLWLEPFETNRSLDIQDPIDAYAGRICSKNILYTVADTYNTYNVVKQSGAQLDKYQTNLSDKFRNQNAWWMPLLIVINVVVGVGFLIGGLFMWGIPQKLFGKGKKKIEDGVGVDPDKQS